MSTLPGNPFSWTAVGINVIEEPYEANFSMMDKSVATRHLWCAETDVITLIDALMNVDAYSETTASSSGIGLYCPPWAFPLDPFMVIRDINVKTWPGPAGTYTGGSFAGGIVEPQHYWGGSGNNTYNDYLSAGLNSRVTLTYSNQDYQANNIGNIRFGFAQEVYTTGNEAGPFFSYTSSSPTGPDANDVPVDLSPPILNTLVNITCTRYNLLAIPANTIATAQASPVNSATLSFGGLTFPAGRVRFDSVSTPSRIIATGIELWNMEISLIARPYSWNSVERPGYSTPQPVYVKGTSNGLYGTSDLNLLFTGLT